jgi:hypothetical protein
MPVASKVRLVDLSARDFETITVSTVAKTLDTTKIGVGFFLTVEGADIRYRFDGTAPTASVGHLLLDGGSIQMVNTGNTADFQMIRDAGVDATVTVTHY